MLEHPMSRHSPSSGGSCELDPLPAEICASADRGARAAGRLLPTGHPSLWSFPGYSRTLTPWAIAGLQAETLPCPAVSSSLPPCWARQGRRPLPSAHCSVPLHLPGFLLHVRCPGCGWGVRFPPQEPRQCPSSGLFPLVGPVSDLPIEMGFPARREQLGGPGECAGLRQGALISIIKRKWLISGFPRSRS